MPQIDLVPAGDGWRLVLTGAPPLPPGGLEIGTVADLKDGRFKIATRDIGVGRGKISSAEFVLVAKDPSEVLQIVRDRMEQRGDDADDEKQSSFSEFVYSALCNMNWLAMHHDAARGFVDGVCRGLAESVVRCVKEENEDEFWETFVTNGHRYAKNLRQENKKAH